MIDQVNKPNKFFAFLMSVIVLFVIWLRTLRDRPAYNLMDELNPLTWKIMFFCLILVLLSIILRIYLFLRLTKYSQNQNTHDAQKRGLYGQIYEKFSQTWVVNKINQNHTLRQLIDIYLNIGVYNYLILHFALTIALTKFLKICDYIWNIFVFGRVDLLKLVYIEFQGHSAIDLGWLVGTTWSKFMYNSVYYIFKFIPILSFNCIGLYEIFVNYELNYFYKSMWILLIPFLFSLLNKIEGLASSERAKQLSEEYKIISFGFAYDVPEEGVYYQISSFYLTLSAEHTVKFPHATENSKQLNDQLAEYTYCWLKVDAANCLCNRLKSYVKLDLFLSILTAIYLGSLLFYSHLN